MMRATQSPCVLCLLLICVITVSGNVIPYKSTNTPSATLQDVKVRKFEVFDGVHVTIPQDDDGRMMSIQLDTNRTMEEGRGKKKKLLLQRLLPLFVMPFLIQSSIVPLFLSVLKFMLVKSLLIGKLALVLIIINAFKNHNSFKGRHDADIANVHYGYHGNGMEEYGAYLN